MDAHFERMFAVPHAKRRRDGEEEATAPTDERGATKRARGSAPAAFAAGAAGERAGAAGERAGAAGERAGEAHPDIDALLKEADKEAATLDAGRLRQMVLSFEKKIAKNQLMRTKYADNPERFMQSEVELDEEVSKLTEVAAYPHLYADLVSLGTVASICGLLAHENTDIAIDTVDVLYELTDPQAFAESESAMGLIDALLANSALELLMQNFSRMDESQEEDKRCVHSTLGVVENLVEINPELATTVGEKTNVLALLLKRVQAREFDENKLYSSEVLAILLQNSEANRRKLGELEEPDGVDLLLQSVAHWRKRDPQSADEQECCANLYDCLCSAMLLPANQDRFLRAQGLELMLRVIKDKRFAKHCAIKAIDFVVANNATSCQRLVDLGGLSLVFPAFMAKGFSTHFKKQYVQEAELEEHATSIVAHLCRQLEGEHRLRLLLKFVENNFEKADRVVELVIKYRQMVTAAQEEGEEDESEDEVEEAEARRLLRRLDAGLFTLQRAATIIGNACEDAKIYEHMFKKLHEQGMAVREVRDVLLEYAETVGDPKNQTDEQVQAERQRVRALADRL